jgi:hypothetical protein
MEFATEAHKVCYEMVASMLKDLFGEFARPHPDVPEFGLVVGSALARIRVNSWGPASAVITGRAYVVTGAEITPEMMEFLLKANNKLLFGAFGLDEQNNVFFDHTLIGTTCDKEELKNMAMMVVRTADEYDDQIVARWGGKRAMDNA